MTQHKSQWVDKFAPTQLSECVLKPEHRQRFAHYIDSGDIPNLLLAGQSGMGKTTITKLLCEVMGLELLPINCGEEGGIEMVRTKVRQFAQATSMFGGLKVVLLDEADNLSRDAQGALKATIEEFSENCRFFLTTNHIQRIETALRGRFTPFDFTQSNSALEAEMVERAQHILQTEGVEWDNDTLIALVQRHSPNFRQVVYHLQRSSTSGTLVVDDATSNPVSTLIQALADKDTPTIVSWVRQHSEGGGTTLQLANTLTNEAVANAPLTSLPHILYAISSTEALSVGEAFRHQLTLATQVAEVWG